MDNQLVRGHIFMGRANGKETSMWENTRMRKNMVRAHILPLRVKSMKENGKMEKDGTAHSMTKMETSPGNFPNWPFDLGSDPSYIIS